ncbi:outer membrane usher protein PefC [Salmonella enterica]|uniref:PefC/AfrB family outer membrane usher protein n=1 Tax=Escherichia fergusonii TaxID=564 RepID=UPI00127FE7A7|nr:PefC/AfrB family outer membrane usher protein [Escherichia fergusonii]EAW8382113.1 outer membrane usher protein PefC [Salmonella enterica]ECI6759076.1 outer membrane usher protein PefC [Salmonella enterica subsp. enterica serovar Mbandaka]EJC1536208.1 PefC/AfrB family outer membrane usher protein [Salmonella enterica subsp. enterica serovar Montevideo]EAY4988083.1 outer membrane usher protein PefC [Salmonella enterica]MBA8503783.1 PefC/AfrB family outer membrane usher protein [Escherichia f
MPVWRCVVLAFIGALPSFCFATDAVRESDLNLDFFYGSETIPAILKADFKYPPGSYYVDIVINNSERIGKALLNISEKESRNGTLCLSESWIRSNSIPIRLSEFNSTLNKIDECYELGKKKHVNIIFDPGSQVLKFSIPQLFLTNKTAPEQWDYGINAGRLRYSGNFLDSSGQRFSYFGNADVLLNISHWALRSNMNLSKNRTGKEKFAFRDITASTPVSSIQGDLALGRSWTRSDLFSDFGFYGVSLRSNKNMSTWGNWSYAPLITGVAARTTRISVSQNGYIVYSKVVPPGPYQLNDLRPVGNGDLVVVTEDDMGHKSQDVYPVTTLPNMLRVGDIDYNVAVGKKNSGYELKDALNSESGIFWMGSISYGLPKVTFSSAFLVHPKYRSSGVGVARDMGELGAVSVNASLSNAEYSDTNKKGHRIKATYAKSLGDTTNLQLLAYSYQSLGYVEFTNFSRTPHTNNMKSRYEAILSQQLGEARVGISTWLENYWQNRGSAKGGNLSLSKSIFDGNVSLFMDVSYSRSSYVQRPDYSTSIGISVPFYVEGRRHYGTFGGGADNRVTSFSSSVSANLTERTVYSLRTSARTQGERSVGASVDHAFDSIQTSLSVEKTRHSQSISGGVNGQLLATKESGLMLTRDSSRTLGIVSIPDVEGIRFNNSQPTNDRGFTVVGLSGYRVNDISINMDNVPDNLSLQTTSYQVVPVENAVVYRRFGAEHLKRYIFRVRDNNGRVLTGGHAVTEQGLDAGYIAGNGILMMGMLAEPHTVRITTGDGRACSFSVKGKVASATKVQEVKCE